MRDIVVNIADQSFIVTLNDFVPSPITIVEAPKSYAMVYEMPTIDQAITQITDVAELERLRGLREAVINNDSR